MTKISVFKKSFIQIVEDIALSRGKVTNRMIAKRLGIDEKTIRRYRELHPDFDRAFTEARETLRERINRALITSLGTRKKKTVVKTEEGTKTIIEDVLSTHNDAAVFIKMGLKHSLDPEQDMNRDTLRLIMARKIASEITALEAAQLLEVEGIPVPKTLMLEVQKDLGMGDDGVIQPVTIQFVGKEHDDNSEN